MSLDGGVGSSRSLLWAGCCILLTNVRAQPIGTLHQPEIEYADAVNAVTDVAAVIAVEAGPSSRWAGIAYAPNTGAGALEYSTESRLLAPHEIGHDTQAQHFIFVTDPDIH